MAGGKGTRFWPLSRSERPKQLLRIFGSKTLIRETLDRALSLAGLKHTVVVTVAQQISALRKELPMLPPENFLVEPEGRNTAPCIGLAALELASRDPDALMVVLPADHWIAGAPSFRRTIRAALRVADRSEKLVTIGIAPDYPETGYGYIVRGTRLDGNTSLPAFRVSRFKEKPSKPEAERLLRRGALWNSGIFVWRLPVFLKLLEQYQPELFAGLKKISGGRGLAASKRARDLFAREYGKLPNISVDHAVLEKAGSDGKVLTLEGRFVWSDIGSWAAVHRIAGKDARGNSGQGKWLGFEARNCLIHARDRLVVLLGTENLVVVDSGDALLVGSLERSQEVRDLVEALKERGYGAYTVR